MSVELNGAPEKPKKASKQVNAYHHGDLRTALLDEAANMIRSQGEAAFSMRKLAAALGVSRTAPYHHFEDKQALLCAIAEEGFKRFMVSVRVADDCTGKSPTDQLRAYVERYIASAVAAPEYYDLMFGGHIWRSPKLTESLKVESYKAFQAYVDGVREWQERGVISKRVDTLRFSQVSWGTLHGLSRFLIDGIYLQGEAVSQMTDTVVAVFLGAAGSEQ